jgi:hypothetical protein
MREVAALVVKGKKVAANVKLRWWCPAPAS